MLCEASVICNSMSFSVAHHWDHLRRAVSCTFATAWGMLNVLFEQSRQLAGQDLSGCPHRRRFCIQQPAHAVVLSMQRCQSYMCVIPAHAVGPSLQGSACSMPAHAVVLPAVVLPGESMHDASSCCEALDAGLGMPAHAVGHLMKGRRVCACRMSGHPGRLEMQCC